MKGPTFINRTPPGNEGWARVQIKGSSSKNMGRTSGFVVLDLHPRFRRVREPQAAFPPALLAVFIHNLCLRYSSMTTDNFPPTKPSRKHPIRRNTSLMPSPPCTVFSPASMLQMPCFSPSGIHSQPYLLPSRMPSMPFCRFRTCNHTMIPQTGFKSLRGFPRSRGQATPRKYQISAETHPRNA